MSVLLREASFESAGNSSVTMNALGIGQFRLEAQLIKVPWFSRKVLLQRKSALGYSVMEND